MNSFRSCIIGLAAVLSTAVPASADAPLVALANAYYGNTWRHQMVASFEESAKQAKADGLIKDYVIVNGDGSAGQQNSQIGELILRGVKVLLVDAASETADNSVIEKACASGVTVVSFDAIASAPCNTQLNFDFGGYKTKQAHAIFDLMGGKGNVILTRGVLGSAPDNAMYNAQQAVLKDYPNIKVVATVFGKFTASVAQSEIANILPTLPHVDAVLGQGGSDDVGITQAFLQAGKDYDGKMPIIEGGGSSDFIKWWSAEHAKNGYNTLSMNTVPSIGSAALWLALAIHDGAKVPKKLIMPVATVTTEDLPKYADMPAGQIVSPPYSKEWVQKNLLNQ